MSGGSRALGGLALRLRGRLRRARNRARARSRRAFWDLRGWARRRVHPVGGPTDEHWTRIVVGEAIAARIEELGPAGLDAVEISGDAHRNRGWRSFESLDFPDFDLCAPLAEGRRRYDVVLCEQVLEHVVDPIAAVANLRGLCEPGGHVIVATPFLIRIHELPEYAMHDYWRFTPRGLRTLLERAGLEVVDVGSWGNRGVVTANLDDWVAYRRHHSLGNDPNLPVQVWAFARNPG